MSDADTPGSGSPPSHHLAAVWFADLVGYTALSETNEGEALRAVSRFQAIVRAIVQTHGGRVVKFLGDAALAEFPSTEQAVRSADALRADFARVAEAEGLGAKELRIGVHVGDVASTEEGDLYGDGVNVASRIQVAADPGEVWVSEDVRRQLRQRPELRFASRGAHALKGLRTPLELHAIGIGEAAPAETKPRGASKRSGEGSPRRRALSLAAIGALVAIVLIVGSQFLGRGGDVSEASVAVLPFENLSGDAENEYFSDGMTEEILNALTQVPDLRVAARTSSFAYKGRDVDIREVARDLGVATVLEGSVRREGDDLRITAQLIDARNGFHLWSDTYDRKLESVFAIQEEIATAIVGELKGSLGLGSGERLVRNRTGDIGAYEFYLEARSHVRRRGEGVERAVGLFGQALERDPTFAPAWAGLAEAWTLAPYYRAGSDSAYWFGALAHAEETAAKALEFDPSLVTAHVALGSLHRDRWEWAAAERAFRHALELAPKDPEANQQYAEMLASMGRNEEALPYARRATELDPLAAIRFDVLGYILHNDGQREASRQAFERALALDPTLPWPVNDLVRHYVTGGKYSEADRFLARIDVDAEDPLRRALRALAADNSALAASIVQGDEDLRNDPFLQMAMGNREDALVALDRGVFLEGVPFGITEALWDPYFDPLRGGSALRNDSAPPEPGATVTGRKLESSYYGGPFGPPEILVRSRNLEPRWSRVYLELCLVPRLRSGPRMTKIQADAFLSDPPARVLAAAAILVAGDELYLVDKVLAALLERVVTAPGADQFDLEKRNASDLSPADFESIVSTMPFVNDRRVIVIRSVPELPADTRDRVKSLLESEPRGLCLIGTGGSSMRGNLYQIWEKHGARIVCELPRKSPKSKQVDFDFARWLAGHAKADFGKTMDGDAAAALAELASELQPLYAELEKVAMYVGDAERIRLADVEAVCSGGSIGTVWEWCDAVGARDTARALELLKELLDAGESAYRLVPLLATHFCRLGIVVGLPSKDPSAIMAALPGRSWYGMAKALAEQARRHTPASVARALDLLAEADVMLKSTSHGEEFVLHRHLLEILENAA